MNSMILALQRWQILHRLERHRQELQEHEQIDFEKAREKFQHARVKTEYPK